MPIVYVHGVSTRDEKGWEQLELLLRRYVAPCISAEPETVPITRCYWGDFGARFRFGGLSIPNSPLRQLIKHRPITNFTKAQLSKLRQSSLKTISQLKKSRKSVDHPDFQDAAQLCGVSPDTTESEIAAFETGDRETTEFEKTDFKLSTLSQENLSNILAQAVAASDELDSEETVLVAMAADDIAHDRSTFDALAKCLSRGEEVTLLRKLITNRYTELTNTLKKSKRQLPGLKDRVLANLSESVSRTAHSAGFAATRAAAEVRNPVNVFLTTFIGDVFSYLTQRGNADAPGWIPSTVLAALSEAQLEKQQRGGEPLIVMTHSMGGQLVYDAVTHFLPRMPEYKDLRIDFWCAAASQVGLFEELKLFLESSEEYGLETGKAVPYPDDRQLGYWWNVWDHNDFVSYSAASIMEGVDDESYSTGMALVSAHGGYLVLPSFFKHFVKKLKKAKSQNWRMERKNQPD